MVVREKLDYMTLIGDIVHANARRYPNKKAIIFKDTSFTWPEVNSRINRMGNALLNLGLRKGDRVAMLSLNSHRYLELPFVCGKTGLIFVPLNYRLTEEELLYVISDCRPKALCYSHDYSGMIEKIRGKTEYVHHYISIGKTVGKDVEYEALINGSRDSEPESGEILNENDPVYILYTGGTTGRSKGALMNHRAVFNNLYNAALAEGARPTDVYLIAPPAFHIGVQFPYFVFFHLGCLTVVSEKYEPKECLELIEKHKVTVTMLGGTSLTMLLEFPDHHRYDVSSLRLIEYGAAPIAPRVLIESKAAFKCDFFQIADGTESGMAVVNLLPEDHPFDHPDDDFKRKRLSAAGREAFNVWMRIVDEDGQDVPRGEVGEIVSRSQSMMMGYWGKPEETEIAFRDGWLHMGDIARMDEEGFIYIVDRSKDMIISGGENIYPREVESVLCQHPAVLEAAVIGIPDEKWGESVHAVVVLKEGKNATQEELIEFSKAKLAGYKKPKSVEFTASLPKSSTQKVYKRALREKYWKGHERRVG